MSKTSDLLELPGDVAAGIFSRKGLLEDFERAFTEIEALGMVKLCAPIRWPWKCRGAY